MEPQKRFDGIEGLIPREPVGAVVTIGTKGPTGAPIETDRFYFKLPYAVKEGEREVKPHHPAFAMFNNAEVKYRQFLKGNLVHARREECFEAHLAAMKLPKPWEAPPSRRPACEGDGENARRYFGLLADKSEDWREIPCPNEKCEFRQGNVKACKPSMRLLFRPRWTGEEKMPTPLTKLASASWNSASAFVGFFDYLESQAKALGLTEYSLYGLPFSITLSMKTQPTHQRRFPVMSISPEADLIEFFLRQVDSRARFVSIAPDALPAALTDADEKAKLGEDLAEITPGHVAAMPSNAAPEVVDAEPIEDFPRTISTEAVSRVLKLASDKGLEESQVDKMLGARLRDAPPSFELEALRIVQEYKPKGAKR